MESVIATNVTNPDSDSSSFKKLTPTPAVLKNRLPTPAVLKNRLPTPTPVVLKNRLPTPTPAVLKNRLPTPTPAVLKTDSRLLLQLKTCDSTDSRLRLHNPAEIDSGFGFCGAKIQNTLYWRKKTFILDMLNLFLLWYLLNNIVDYQQWFLFFKDSGNFMYWRDFIFDKQNQNPVSISNSV